MVLKALTEVHDALVNDKFVKIKISWIKYNLWKKSPRFYATSN